MITKTGTWLVKAAEADEEALAKLVEALRNRQTPMLTLGTLHPNVMERIREEKRAGKFRYPDVVLKSDTTQHLIDERIDGDGYSPEYIAEMFRNVLNNPDAVFDWSVHHGPDKPKPVLRSMRSGLPEDKFDFMPINQFQKRIGVVSMYDPSMSKWNRVLEYHPEDKNLF